MDILRRSLAPIADAAWKEIFEQSQVVLTSVLSARKFVDVEGPKGWSFAALSTGRIEIPKDQSGNIEYGIHKVLPLVEVRIPFELDIWELDNVSRGAQDIDLSHMEDAARELARFEESVIYEGLAPANIQGLKSCSIYDTQAFPENGEDILATVTHILAQFHANSIEGPYSLILGQKHWELVNSYTNGYPLRKELQTILGGSIVMAPYIEDAYIISERGGDLKMAIGQDISIGYKAANTKTVQLYFTESFTFHIIEPAAVAVFKPSLKI
jgi:uncharacterized linocin/CFP29 family protein